MRDRALESAKILAELGFKAPYQSPHVSSLDTAVFNYLLRNMQRYGNFGFPEGMQMDLGFLEDLLPSKRGSVTGKKVRLGGPRSMQTIMRQYNLLR